MVKIAFLKFGKMTIFVEFRNYRLFFDGIELVPMCVQAVQLINARVLAKKKNRKKKSMDRIDRIDLLGSSFQQRHSKPLNLI